MTFYTTIITQLIFLHNYIRSSKCHDKLLKRYFTFLLNFIPYVRSYVLFLFFFFCFLNEIFKSRWEERYWMKTDSNWTGISFKKKYTSFQLKAHTQDLRTEWTEINSLMLTKKIRNPFSVCSNGLCPYANVPALIFLTDWLYFRTRMYREAF